MLANVKILVATVFTGVIALTGVRADGGFTNSCQGHDLSYNDGYYLTSYCDQDNGAGRNTAIKLGDCIGNSNGVLVGEAGGAFGNSCTECAIYTSEAPCAYSPACLVCQYCESSHGGVAGWIGLDSVIGNSDGHLVCNGGYGY